MATTYCPWFPTGLNVYIVAGTESNFISSLEVVRSVVDCMYCRPSILQVTARCCAHFIILFIKLSIFQEHKCCNSVVDAQTES
jgi:hypothetical protein